MCSCRRRHLSSKERGGLSSWAAGNQCHAETAAALLGSAEPRMQENSTSGYAASARERCISSVSMLAAQHYWRLNRNSRSIPVWVHGNGSALYHLSRHC